MQKKCVHRIPAPPARKELSDNPVKLCSEISRLFHMKIRENCDMDGVMSQPGARLILSLLAIKDGVNQRELVSKTHLRAPTVSVIIKKMLEADMVELRADENDMRVKKVYLTEYGRQTDSEGIQKIKSIDALGLRGITESEQATLMELLGKIRKNLLEE